jgi:hypothetical protein
VFVGDRLDREVDGRHPVTALHLDLLPEELPVPGTLDGLAGPIGRVAVLEPVGVPHLLADHVLAVDAAELQGGVVGLDQCPVGLQQPRELERLVEDGLEPPLALPTLGDVTEVQRQTALVRVRSDLEPGLQRRVVALDRPGLLGGHRLSVRLLEVRADHLGERIPDLLAEQFRPLAVEQV